jgi:hypothetical protein
VAAQTNLMLGLINSYMNSFVLMVAPRFCQEGGGANVRATLLGEVRNHDPATSQLPRANTADNALFIRVNAGRGTNKDNQRRMSPKALYCFKPK